MTILTWYFIIGIFVVFLEILHMRNEGDLFLSSWMDWVACLVVLPVWPLIVLKWINVYRDDRDLRSRGDES